MDVEKLSLEAFLGNVTRSNSTTMSASAIIQAYAFEIDGEYTIICDYGLFKIVDLGVDQSDVGLSYNNKLIGLYKGPHLFIDYPENYIGKKGLSTPMILIASRNRPVPTERNLTDAGEKALTKAWRVAKGIETSPWWPC